MPTCFDETSAPVPTIDFDFDAVEASIHGPTDPRDERGRKLRAALGLLLQPAGEKVLTVSRLALVDGLLNPVLRPRDLCRKWNLSPRRYKNAARELSSVFEDIDQEGGAK